MPLSLAQLCQRLVALDAAFTRYNSTRSLLDVDAALEQRDFRGAAAFRDVARASNHYYNRIVAPTGQQVPHLDEVVAWYHDRGIHCGLTTYPDRTDEALLDALAHRSFRVTATDCYFWLDLDEPPPDDATPKHITLRRATESDLDVVFSIFLADEPDPPVSGDTLRRRRAAHLDPRFPLYLAELRGEPVAMASSFIDGDVAFLGNANTLVRARGNGCQRALLSYRLGHARSLGCIGAATDTRFGTASHRNVLRSGMKLALQTLSWQLDVSSADDPDAAA